MKLRVLALHPIQYQAPLWRELSQHEGVTDFEVWFMSRGMTAGGGYDPGFDRHFSWDMDLTSGYAHRYFRNLSARSERSGIFSRINPGVITSIRKVKPDAIIVIGHGTITSILALAYSRALSVPTILYGDYSQPQRRFLGSVRRSVVRLATAGAFVGGRNRHLYTESGLREHRLIEVPFSIDTSHFVKNRSPEHTPNRRPIAIFAAKLIKLKRHADVLHALAAISTERRPLLRIIGSGPEEQNLRELATNLGIDRDVEWRGFVNYSEMPNEYQVASVSILASDREAWGLAVNESMAASVPAIVSEACGCVDDLVIEGITGHRFSVGDVSYLSRLLLDVV